MMLKPLAAFTLFASLAGCDTVSVDKPFGDPVDNKVCDSLCGDWATHGGDVYRLERDTASELALSMPNQPPPANGTAKKASRLVVRTVGGMTLVFAPVGESPESRFGFAWLDRSSDGAVSVRLCDTGMFRTAVENGTLEGEVSDKKGHPRSVSLVVSERLHNLLRSPKGHIYFKAASDKPFRLISTAPAG